MVVGEKLLSKLDLSPSIVALFLHQMSPSSSASSKSEGKHRLSECHFFSWIW
ncbi:hypothetical protein I603_2122 [Erythrobacter dokdonensis DSW-74]|uniref:Uncharacterized protein n=1 Tax=Erythrobacter dokdonensis DSW-74 TaxID=1300349 RepID=A0A1A7BH31_9SPHN|nr:hypothetical protein I603_2122 [Erythrobacter dokdonensis DSW-74]